MDLRTKILQNTQDENIKNEIKMEIKTKKEKDIKFNKKDTKSKTKIKSIHKDHRSRLKSQFLENGLDALTDVQKLELLLFYAIPLKDTNPLAHNLLHEFGTIKNVFTADISALIKVPGVKESSAILIKYVGSMLNFCDRPEEENIISSTAIAKEFITKYYSHVDVEQFYVFCLTKSNKVKKSIMINSGTVDEVSVQIRTITQVAIENKCDRIIVSHNHPAGKAVMSDQDCRFTYSLICSCLLNNIELLDHIIVGADRTISLLEQGIIEKLKCKSSDTIQLSSKKRIFISEVEKTYEKSMIDE